MSNQATRWYNSPMNALPPLGNLRRDLSANLEKVRQSRFFHDRLSVGLIVAALIVSAANIILLLPNVHPSDIAEPVRYSSLNLGYTLGAWYYPYIVALTAVVVTLVNATLAFQSFTRSRLGSFFLLLGGMVFAVFSFVISSALGTVR